MKNNLEKIRKEKGLETEYDSENVDYFSVFI